MNRLSNMLLAATIAGYGIDYPMVNFYDQQSTRYRGGYNGRHYPRKPNGHNFTNCGRRVTRWEAELKQIMFARMARR